MPTEQELQQYGAGLSIWDQLRLFQEWSPLLGYGQRIVNERDRYAQTIIVSEACEWLASKTRSTTDDELIRLLAAIVQTKEGEALVRWCLSKAEEAK